MLQVPFDPVYFIFIQASISHTRDPGDPLEFSFSNHLQIEVFTAPEDGWRWKDLLGFRYVLETYLLLAAT